MRNGTVGENAKAFAYKKVLTYLDKDPVENLPKVLDWLEKYDSSDSVSKQSEAVRAILSDPDNNWNKLVTSLWTDIDAEVRKKLFETIAINGTMIGSARQKKNIEKYGCNIPWAILMDPTSACNLRCTGCWAAEYGHSMNLTYDELDSVINQGTELGCFIYIFSGGEPMVRKDDIIKLCEAHQDCAFLAFTNGTLIDEKFADEMLRVKNFIPAISVEGFEEATDSRRGSGTFKRVMRAMEILRERKLLFGISCCYTSKNVDVIGSEEYFDAMVGWGAKFCWFFTYMPVGKDAPTDLMVSAEQREKMFRQVRRFRGTKPLFTLDFWNDGEYVHGCIAGGRLYLHINAGGDIEPCAFMHYSDSNIREKTLLEALQSPMFMEYHREQPFSDNMLRPCPALDNPDALPRMVERAGAHSTDFLARETASEYTDKCRSAAENWKPVADKLWAEGHIDVDMSSPRRSK